MEQTWAVKGPEGLEYCVAFEVKNSGEVFQDILRKHPMACLQTTLNCLLMRCTDSGCLVA